jgi:outer membrane protein OmpA-like peptidoglycan-associated protein
MRYYVILFFIPFFAFSQQKDYTSCENALDLNPTGSYSLFFTGKKGVVPSEGVFQHISSPTKNQIWVHFTSVNKGNLTITFSKNQSLVDVLILKEKGGNICSGLKEQNLQVLLEKSIDSMQSLSTQIAVDENDQFYILLIAKEKLKQEINTAFSFELDESEKNKTWPLNLVYNEDLQIYSIVVRDLLNKKAVEARILLQGSAEINGIYRGSDIEMNLIKKIKTGAIRVDAEGYLSSDLNNTPIPIGSDFKDTIWLKPIQEGMISGLDDVYFAAGLATILEESYPKLKRLRDFLILNPNTYIEVHGHVNEDNDKNLVSMKLSKKRAQRVVDYLIEGGVEEKRLKAIGFGNTKPIYKNPQSEEEKEANRRVEVLIISN